MAITKRPTTADATAAYAVTRAFYWAGDVAPVGSVLQLTKSDAAPLLSANKIAPAPVAEGPEADKPKAKKSAEKVPAKPDDKATDKATEA